MTPAGYLVCGTIDFITICGGFLTEFAYLFGEIPCIEEGFVESFIAACDDLFPDLVQPRVPVRVGRDRPRSELGGQLRSSSSGELGCRRIS